MWMSLCSAGVFPVFHSECFDLYEYKSAKNLLKKTKTATGWSWTVAP